MDPTTMGTEPITGTRTVSIELWLRQLHRTNGEILANATKAKIRNIFSVIFNHAIRYEWLEQRICFPAVRPLLQRRTGISSFASTTMRLKVSSTCSPVIAP